MGPLVNIQSVSTLLPKNQLFELQPKFWVIYSFIPIFILYCIIFKLQCTAITEITLII